MTTEDVWLEAIKVGQALIVAERKGLESFQRPTRIDNSVSDPVWVLGDDSRMYVAKGLKQGELSIPKGYQLAADAVVGRLGNLLGAPVPEVVLLGIDQETCSRYSELQDKVPGFFHGSCYSPNSSPRLPIDAARSPDDAKDYALLAVLYGWMGSGDDQIIRSLAKPERVLSVDHGHFFNNGAPWGEVTFGSLGAAVPHAGLVTNGADLDTLRVAVDAVKQVSDDQIRSVVAKVPVAWGVPIGDLVSLARFIARRRDSF